MLRMGSPVFAFRPDAAPAPPPPPANIDEDEVEIDELNSQLPIGPSVINDPIGAAGVRKSHHLTARSSDALMRILESRADQRIDFIVFA